MQIEKLSLRIRMLLFFAALAFGSILAVALGLLVALRRFGDGFDPAPLVQGGIIASFGILGLAVWVWYLFDIHVARPIGEIASAMRAHAHARVSGGLSGQKGRYLGDLAGAVCAAADELAEGRNAIAESIARETTRLTSDKEKLEHLLADVPPAILLCSAHHRLVFYNGVAQRFLSRAGAPVCLDRNLFDFLHDGPVRTAHQRLLEAGSPDAVVEFVCGPVGGARHFAGRMRLAGDGVGMDGAYVITLRDVSGELADFTRRDRLLQEVFTDLLPALERLPEARTQAVTQICERFQELATDYSESRSPYGLAVTARLAATVEETVDHFEPLHSVVYDFDLLARSHSEKMVRMRLEELTYVVFDTETTGLLPAKGDEIVQIAAVRVVNGRIVKGEVFDTLVNPGRAIPQSATAIHGVSDDMVADAPGVNEVVERFHSFCEGAVLVAHNAPFDMEFLYRREKQIGRSFKNPVLDTVLLSAVVFGQWDNHTLDALVERLEIDLPAEARHTAIGDAIATAQALIKIQSILAGQGIERLEDLLQQTRRHGRLIRDLNRGL